ncbi:hypothetical protein [Leptospira alexanderi]|uniref:hypothetical protein n=1 Tax=Leptospira alexanderi TaxID=100053 RepID=UPI00138B1266|nr:hypothetical protein [Leptospira alexanderi]
MKEYLTNQNDARKNSTDQTKMWGLPNQRKINDSMSHSVQNLKGSKNQLIKIFLELLTPG